MKVIAEVELNGEFENLTEGDAEVLISEVYNSGLEACSCYGSLTVKQVLEK